jgi:uncharacterized protein YlxW (UPF0749 family)
VWRAEEAQKCSLPSQPSCGLSSTWEPRLGPHHFTLWQWRSVVYGATGVVLFTLVVGFLEWKAQRRERARDKADKAELIRLLQESQEQNRAEFQTLKAEIKAINQKPEAAQQKARLVSSSIPRSARFGALAPARA